MRFTVFLDSEPIGTSDLEHIDGGMGVATGRFVPAPGYARARAVFRGHAEAHGAEAQAVDLPRLRRMWAERDALGLELRDRDGAPVATEWVQVYDYGEEAGEEHGYELEVKLGDSAGLRGHDSIAPAV